MYHSIREAMSHSSSQHFSPAPLIFHPSLPAESKISFLFIFSSYRLLSINNGDKELNFIPNNFLFIRSTDSIYNNFRHFVIFFNYAFILSPARWSWLRVVARRRRLSFFYDSFGYYFNL